MEIHQLEMLRELGALGSVKAVADTLLVTPSAVSQQLAQLQKSVEVPLTRKEGRNLVLTEAGQVLADAGAAVVSAMADARMAIGAYHGSTGGAGDGQRVPQRRTGAVRAARAATGRTRQAEGAAV